MAGIIPAIFVKNHPSRRSAPIDGTIRTKRCFALVAEAPYGLHMGLYYRALRAGTNQSMESRMNCMAAFLAAGTVAAVGLAAPAWAQVPTPAERGIMTPPMDQQSIPADTHVNWVHGQRYIDRRNPMDRVYGSPARSPPATVIPTRPPMVMDIRTQRPMGIPMPIPMGTGTTPPIRFRW